MYIQFLPAKLNQVREVLRDHNLPHATTHEVVQGGNPFVNIRDDQVAVNILQRLKALGAWVPISPPPTLNPK